MCMGLSMLKKTIEKEKLFPKRRNDLLLRRFCGWFGGAWNCKSGTRGTAAVMSRRWYRCFARSAFRTIVIRWHGAPPER